MITTSEAADRFFPAKAKDKSARTEIAISTEARIKSAFFIMRTLMAHFHEKNRILIFPAAVFLLVFIISQTGCGKRTDLPVSGQDFCFDTVCTVTVYDIETGGHDEAEKLIDEVFERCVTYEKLLSRTKEGSDVYRINHAGGEGVICDDITVDLIETAIRYCALSGGDFDISVGGLTKQWDFRSDEPDVPSDENIKEAVKHVGFDNIVVSGNEVRLRDPLCEIDLGAVAKGYIADRLTEFMEQRGVKSAVISLGGNIVCIGEKKDGRESGRFRIGIETPYSDQRKISGVVAMSDETAVTSGVYERFFEKDGKMYHHILDPKTGYPADTDLLSVTVISGKGRSADCDALATICVLKGADEGKRFLKGMTGYEGFFIDKNGVQYATDGFILEER